MEGSSNKPTAEWMEWPANALTARIQMPLNLFRKKVKQYIEKNMYIEQVTNCHEVDIMHYVIYDLSEFFSVSRQSAKIRMIDAGFTIAIGVDNYVDGELIPPYVFPKEDIEKYWSYSINLKEKEYLMENNATFATLLNTGEYLHIESHFCRNDPKYVYANSMHLTDYARWNIKDCCIPFTRTTTKGNKYSYTELGSILYRPQNESLQNNQNDNMAENHATFNYKFELVADSFENEDKTLGQAMIKSFDDQRALSRDFQKKIIDKKNQFGTMLIALMDYKNIHNEELAAKIRIDRSKVRKSRNNDDYPKSIDDVVAICLGLKLPTCLSNELIEKSGFTLRAYQLNEHNIYRF